MSSKSNESIENESDENEEIQVIEVIDNGSEGKRKENLVKRFLAMLKVNNPRRKGKLPKFPRRRRRSFLFQHGKIFLLPLGDWETIGSSGFLLTLKLFWVLERRLMF